MTEWDYNFSSNIPVLTNVEICRTTVALFDLHADNKPAPKSLQLAIEPREKRGVTVLKEFAKDSLVLVPVTSHVACTKSFREPVPSQALPITCTCTSTIVYVTESNRRESTPEAKSGCDQKAVTPEFMAAFWIVGSTQKSADANMKLTVMQDDKESLKIPCLVNCKPLKVGDVLKMYHDGQSNKRFGTFTAPNKRRKIGA